MALEVPVRSSSTGYGPVFPPNMSYSNSPEPRSKRPPSSQRIPAHYDLMSPSDVVGPSPVTSTGTASTEIEDQEADNHQHQLAQLTEPPQLTMLQISDNMRRSPNQESLSVIHAPQDFTGWTSRDNQSQSGTEIEAEDGGSESQPESQEMDNEIGRHPQPDQRRSYPGAVAPSPLTTNGLPDFYGTDDITPNAHDHRAFSESSRSRPRSTSSLEKIEEVDDYHVEGDRTIGPEDPRVSSFRVALQQMWESCKLSYGTATPTRSLAYERDGMQDGFDQTFTCCWQLCQLMYEIMDEPLEGQRLTAAIHLARDLEFRLFESRPPLDPKFDALLRSLNEFGQHMFNGHDMQRMPEEFTDRTFQFYIIICHRLMKLRPANSPLQACWSLTEKLANIHKSRVRTMGAGEEAEFLSEAVRACLDLSDVLNRRNQPYRPSDHATPRPGQNHYSPQASQNHYSPQPERIQRERLPLERSESRASTRSKRSKHSVRSERLIPMPPETPVTEFEDTPLSPDITSPSSIPNIMVLGGPPSYKEWGAKGLWSSGASNFSGYSQKTSKTSSTATTATQAEDPYIAKIKILMLKLAILLGFERDTAGDGKAGMLTLKHWIRDQGKAAFGDLPSRKSLFQKYERLVFSEFSGPRAGVLPPRGKRATASEIALSVMAMADRGSQYAFLRHVYYEVFEFYPEEADSKTDVSTLIYV